MTARRSPGFFLPKLQVVVCAACGYNSPGGRNLTRQERNPELQDITWATLKRIAASQVEEIYQRALLMDRIHAIGPVGRRTLAASMQLSEREVRAAAEALKAEGLIVLNTSGMLLSEEGLNLLPEVRALCRSISGLFDLESQLKERLGLDQLAVVPGDADQDRMVLVDLGRATAQFLHQVLKDNMIIAVSGGSTMSEVARAMTPVSGSIMVVPARGGFGRMAQMQADAVASELAQHIGGDYRLMHLPEGMDSDTLSKAAKLPGVRATLALMRNADIILYGVGRADDMAQRRGFSLSLRRQLMKEGAVGEALGDFFNIAGKVIHQSPSLSSELGTGKHGAVSIMSAAGTRKAEAVLAAVRWHPPWALVVDEGLGYAILDLLNKGDHTSSK